MFNYYLYLITDPMPHKTLRAATTHGFRLVRAATGIQREATHRRPTPDSTTYLPLNLRAK